MWSVLWVISLCVLFVVGDTFSLLCLTWPGGVASRDFRHRSEPFLCICIAMAVFFACVGSALYVRASD